MRKLSDFRKEYVESKVNEQNQQEPIQQVVESGDDKDKQVDVKNIEGKDAEDNGTEGLWAVDEPKDDEALVEDIPQEDWEGNIEMLSSCFDGKTDFFVQGRAGWAKTSIIVDLAKRNRLTVLTVYLDKAEAVDLAGIPAPVEDKKTGRIRQENIMPVWAQYMWDRPKKNFLLFFDEMNQATPDVQNALMPIILNKTICGRKFKNYFVGAAGNMADENSALTELSKPLESRFEVIEWESNTERTWAQSFRYLRKKWLEEYGDGIMDYIEEACKKEVFPNPRHIDGVLGKLKNMKEGKNASRYSVDSIFRTLRAKASHDLPARGEEQLKKIAEMLHDYLNGKVAGGGQGRGRRKGQQQIPKEVQDQIISGIKKGYIQLGDDPTKWGISKENIKDVIDIEGFDEELNAEMLERFISKCEEDGMKFKFQKDEEWRKAGYKDPNEAE